MLDLMGLREESNGSVGPPVLQRSLMLAAVRAAMFDSSGAIR